MAMSVQLVHPAGWTSWTDKLDRPVLFIWSLGQFAYSKIFLSVCTLSQLPSPTKALFFDPSSSFTRKGFDGEWEKKENGNKKIVKLWSMDLIVSWLLKQRLTAMPTACANILLLQVRTFGRLGGMNKVSKYQHLIKTPFISWLRVRRIG